MPKPRHRGPGEGSYAVTPQGVRYVITTSPGHRKYFTARTRAAARAKAQAWLTEEAERAGRLTAGITLRDYAERWLSSDALATRTRPQTVGRYRQALNRVVAVVGDVPVAELTSAHVQQVIGAMTSAGYAVGTIRLTRTILSVLLTAARRQGLITVNPVADSSASPAQRKPMVTFTADQREQLLTVAEAHGRAYWPLWTVMLSLGLRLGEALGVRWQDVDLGADTLTITGQVVARVRLPYAKTRRAHRTLPLPSGAARALRAQKMQQEDDKAKTDGWPDAHGLVFTTAAGRAHEHTAVRRAYYRALVEADLPRLHPHAGSRHTLVKLLLDQGVPLVVISRFIGHSKIATTADIYTEVDLPLFVEALGRLERPKPGNNGSS